MPSKSSPDKGKKSCYMLKIETGKNRRFFLTDIAVLILILWFFWILITSDLSYYSLGIGFIIVLFLGLFAHFFFFGNKGKNQKSLKEYFFALEHLFAILFSTLFRLIVANAIVIYQAITLNIHPRIVKIKVNVQSDLEITIISTLITLTPGTLVIDVEDAEDGGSYIYVHFSYLKTDDPQKYIENTIGKWDAMIGALFT